MSEKLTKEMQLKIKTELAQKRLEYFVNIKKWCDDYLIKTNKAKLDTVQIDKDAEFAVKELRSRVTQLIIDDSLEIASYSLSGDFTWSDKPPIR
jgi:hypothetical protein